MWRAWRGTAEGGGLLVLETFEAESEARKEMHLNAAGKAGPALLAISDVNILILHGQLTALTNQRLISAAAFILKEQM